MLRHAAKSQEVSRLCPLLALLSVGPVSPMPSRQVSSAWCPLGTQWAGAVLTRCKGSAFLTAYTPRRPPFAEQTGLLSGCVQPFWK